MRAKILNVEVMIGCGESNTFMIVFCRAWAATAGMSFVFNLSSFLIGLIIYAAFRYCDPIKDGVIFSKDQVIRGFVIYCHRVSVRGHSS